MKTIIVHAEREKMKKIMNFLEELKVDFETGEDNNPYNPDFVEKIKRSQQQYKEGNYRNVAREDLEGYLNS